MKMIGSGKTVFFEMLEDEYSDHVENNNGLCIHCGEEASNIEPDARQLILFNECESCGKNGVYGVEELLVMGRIQFKIIVP